MGKAKIGARPMIDNPRKGTMDGYRCELCGAWVSTATSARCWHTKVRCRTMRPGSMPCPICNRYRRAPPSVRAVLDAKPASRSTALPRRVPALSIGPCGAPNAAISMKRRSKLTPSEYFRARSRVGLGGSGTVQATHHGGNVTQSIKLQFWKSFQRHR